MELIYIWIGKPGFAGYINQGFCFNSKYIVTFDGVYEPTIQPREDFIRDFYHVQDSNIVNSITCIVGENGAGKTCLLELINEVCRHRISKPKLEFCIIWEKDDCINYYYNHGEKDNTKSLLKQPTQSSSTLEINSMSFLEFDKSFNDLTIINYSSLFNNSSFVKTIWASSSNHHRQIDLTTDGIINTLGNELNDYNLRENSEINNIIDCENTKLYKKDLLKLDKLDFYKIKDLNDKVLFYNDLNKIKSKYKKFFYGKNNSFGLKILRDCIRIEPYLINYEQERKQNYKQAFDLAENHNSRTNGFYKTISENHNSRTNGFYKTISENTDSFYLAVCQQENIHEILIWRIIFSYWLLFVDTLVFDSNLIAKSEFLSSSLLLDITKKSDPFAILNKLIFFALDYLPEYDERTKTRKAKYENSNQAFNKFYNCLNELVNNEYSRINLEGFWDIKLNNKSTISICQLVDYYYKSFNDMSHGEYVKFSFVPRLCSGEQSLLTLFSRLHCLNSGKYKNQIAQNILLLIDEGETCFHPDWQRKYILTLILLLAVVFKHNKKASNLYSKQIQIILTTNSPILLSDLRRDDIIYLKNKCVDSNHKKPFASEINTLYEDSFFINGSLIGDFALTKIKPIIDYLNSKEALKNININQFKDIIDLIGDESLKKYLDFMLKRKQGFSAND